MSAPPDAATFVSWASDQRVFISSAMGGLAALRKRLAEAIAETGAEPVWFEDLVAATTTLRSLTSTRSPRPRWSLSRRGRHVPDAVNSALQLTGDHGRSLVTRTPSGQVLQDLL